MKNKTAVLYFILIFLFSQCAQNYGCVERVTIQDNVSKTESGFEFEPSYWIDLPCDYDVENKIKTSKVVNNFTYKLVRYNYTPNTGNNSSKLEFEVILENNNNFEIEGLPIFIMSGDGIEFSANYHVNSSSCSSISANSTCTFTYEKETPFTEESFSTLELVGIKFLLPK